MPSRSIPLSYYRPVESPVRPRHPSPNPSMLPSVCPSKCRRACPRWSADVSKQSASEGSGLTPTQAPPSPRGPAPRRLCGSGPAGPDPQRAPYFPRRAGPPPGNGLMQVPGLVSTHTRPLSLSLFLCGEYSYGFLSHVPYSFPAGSPWEARLALTLTLPFKQTPSTRSL